MPARGPLSSVELTARPSETAVTRAGVDEPPMGHHGVAEATRGSRPLPGAAACAACRAAPSSAGPACSHEWCSRAARAAPTSRRELADRRPGARPRLSRYVERPATRLRQAASSSASNDRPLVAGQLQVDDELDRPRTAPRRGVRAPRRASAACACPRPRSRAPRSGHLLLSGSPERSGSTSSSIMSTPWASAASKLARRVAGLDQVRPLVADTSHAFWLGHRVLH